MSDSSGAALVFSPCGLASVTTLSMYEPGNIFAELVAGSVFRYGANVALNSSGAPYHAPFSCKLTLPLEEPLVKRSSAPSSGGTFVAAKVWKDVMLSAAVEMSRSFQMYSRTMAEGGAGKVCTSMEVTIPKDGEAPRMACRYFGLSQREKLRHARVSKTHPVKVRVYVRGSRDDGAVT